MKRMKLVCPNDPNHKRFTTNVPVMEAWECDEHGDFLGVQATLGPIEKPTKDNEWQCSECDTPAVIEMTGLDQGKIEKGEEKEAEDEEEEEDDDWVPEEYHPDVLDPNSFYWKNTTVPEAHDRIFAVIDRDGKIQCPCCEKIANRQIYGLGFSEAVALIGLIAKTRFGPYSGHPSHTGYVDWRSFLSVRTGLAQLKLWGLVKPKKPDVETGFWKPTQDGIDFAENGGLVHKMAVKYNGELLFFRTPYIDIKSCFKRETDYEDGVRCMRNEADLSIWIRRMHKLKD